eukprot:CAMPEP_0195123438 /NCGR_PEP_ID=MMETSP0448-20130528/128681_1 /TAXON_ID=66468 /ORGANISM="Heterocapsa triquestra, Strain CCMP 448" /LENGTH=179 /DNA_ID=CAMNT_0040160987 /DNA_START=89 /DNA_END=624 /DNA_ORIENTATION=+
MVRMAYLSPLITLRASWNTSYGGLVDGGDQALLVEQDRVARARVMHELLPGDARVVQVRLHDGELAAEEVAAEVALQRQPRLHPAACGRLVLRLHRLPAVDVRGLVAAAVVVHEAEVRIQPQRAPAIQLGGQVRAQATEHALGELLVAGEEAVLHHPVVVQLEDLLAAEVARAARGHAR